MLIANTLRFAIMFQDGGIMAGKKKINQTTGQSQEISGAARDEAQEAAISHGAGPLLIVAGSGSAW